MKQFQATICKTFTFDAAHFIPTVPDDHKCRRMHGHTYSVDLVIHGDVAPNGFVGGIDYAELDTIWSVYVHDAIDHRVLNDVEGLEIPSTEHLAAWIAIRLYGRLSLECARLEVVRVHESSTTWCEVHVPTLAALGAFDE